MTRRAIVTGANRGIGHEIARQLRKNGISVLGTSRDEERGARAARELGIEMATLDVTDQEQIDALADGIAPGLDILVNNAGIAMDGFDEEVARRTLDVNFFGALAVTDALLPKLGQEAQVVMLSSGMGEVNCIRSEALREKILSKELTRSDLIGLMNEFVHDVKLRRHTDTGWPSSAYRVSKVGLNALVRVYARELESDPRNIRVNAACPGWVRTDMGGRSAPRSVKQGAETPVWVALGGANDTTGGFFRDRALARW